MKSKQERKTWEMAEAIRKEIEKAVAHTGTSHAAAAQVPAIFAAAEGTPQDKGNAFWLLDERPGLFVGYGYRHNTGWHAALRVCRNTPSLGKHLFATFR